MSLILKITPLILILISSCVQHPFDLEAEKQKLLQISHEWSESVATGDLETILSYWADDAIMISPYEPILRGKDEIRKMIEESFDVPGFSISWEPVSVAISKSGDMGYLIEENRISWLDEKETEVVMRNNVVTIWRKDSDGNWKNVVDMMSPKSTFE
jgi:ketosteroid isomerase-like protein